MTGLSYQRWPWLAAAFFVWFWTWKHLSVEWVANAQYHFAWLVPFYFLFAAWLRWDGPGAADAPAGRLLSLAALPVFVLAEWMRWQDPIWRLTGALFALAATLLTAGYLANAGGWPLLRRQVWPLLFAWTCVPWPVPLEASLTQNLLHFVTTCAINLLNLFGADALQQGNTIVLSGGRVGMEDACSGIQSLQAGLMVALLLGEFERLPGAARCLLAAVAGVATVMVNLLRVLGMALITQQWGENGAARAHDLLGLLAVCITIGLIYYFTTLVSPGSGRRLFPARWPDLPAAGASGWILLGLFAMVPIAVGGFAGRILAGRSSGSSGPRWIIDSERAPVGWHSEQVEERRPVWKLLRYTFCETAKFRSDDASTVFAVHLFWAPGHSMPSMAFYHTPALCLPWTGWLPVGQPAETTIPVDDDLLPFTAYRFRQNGTDLTAYHLLSSGGRIGFFSLDPSQSGTGWNRLAMLWRQPLVQVDEELLIYVAGPAARKPGAAMLSGLLGKVLLDQSRGRDHLPVKP